MSAVTVTPARGADATDLAELLVESWPETVIAQGTGYRPAELPALVARDGTGALDQARAHRPGIPPVGAYGIPIRDELELALELAVTATG